MNLRYPLIAAGAGLLGLLLTVIGHGIAFFMTFRLTILGSGALSTSDQVIWYLGVPALGCLASSLPIWALRIPWLRGLIAAFVAHLAAIYMVIDVIVPQQQSSSPDTNFALIFGLEASFTALLLMVVTMNLRSRFRPIQIGLLLLPLLAILIPETSVIIVFCIWVILPAWIAWPAKQNSNIVSG